MGIKNWTLKPDVPSLPLTSSVTPPRLSFLVCKMGTVAVLTE